METTDLIEFASDPAFGLNADMQVTGWNAAARELLGYTGDEIAGMACGQVLKGIYPTGEPLCSMLCEGRACISSGHKWSIESCRIRHKDGEMIPVGISSLVLPHEARKIDNKETVAVIFLRKTGLEISSMATEIPMRIFALGKLRLVGAGKGLNVEGWKRKQAAVVLKCLVSNLDRPVHREQLINWLWPDANAKNGWQRLKVTVSYLRGALRKEGIDGDIIETIGQSYLLRKSAVWVDSDAFASLVTVGWDLLKAGDFTQAQARFDEAESLYRGDLFEDELYADWCAIERERLRELYLEMLSGMEKCYSERHLYIESARVCRTALSTDPCREGFIRSLMESMVKLNRVDWARAHFLSWQRCLDEEYGLCPTPETRAVYQGLFDTESDTNRVAG